MRAKQQHVCKEMNKYTINTNRKWILSFSIEWTIARPSCLAPKEIEEQRKIIKNNEEKNPKLLFVQVHIYAYIRCSPVGCA